MKRKFLWSLLAASAIVTVIWPMIPVAPAKSRLVAVSGNHRVYQIRAVDLTAEDKAFLGKAKAAQYLITMRSGGHLVLTVIDGTENRHAVHDPAYCFSGGGWKIREKRTITVSSGEATLITLTQGSQTAEALWFFDDGKQQFTSPFDYWFKTSCRRMTLGRSGSEPVLVTLRSLTGEPVDWDRVRQILLPSLGFI